ncbi:DUF742 domain-containing protein [Actinocorallia aurea]
MEDRRERWADDAAGPVVRPYAMTRGRTRPTGRTFDLASIVMAVGMPARSSADFDPEHLAAWDLCRMPAAVADIASEMGLPLPVVRVLLADLLDAGFLRVSASGPTSYPPTERIFREILDGLRAL